MSMVRLEPSRARTRPLGSPASAYAATSLATTKLICLAEPVVVRTNHGRASAVILLPVVEIDSPRRRASSRRSRMTLLRCRPVIRFPRALAMFTDRFPDAEGSEGMFMTSRQDAVVAPKY